MYAPTTETKAETFFWYSATPQLDFGLAYLWKQGAVRFLGNVALTRETASRPLIRVGVGVQGIGTGNPGYFTTAEKNFSTKHGNWNAYVGIGLRSNESHGHPLAGIKYSPHGPWTFGIQDDGHARHPFVTFGIGHQSVGLYLIDSRRPAIMWAFAK